MKALKEKRISLRSLLRRSLVILSLLALAFAFVGCSSDDGGSEDIVQPPVTPTPEVPKEAISLKFIRQPITMSFEGMPADLSGIAVEVRFKQGDNEFTETVTDASQFYITPYILDTYNPNVSRTILATNPSLGNDNNFPIYHVTSKVASDTVVLQVIRAFIAGPEAIHWTGNLTKRDYFEDDLVDFAGIVVEGVYAAEDFTVGAHVNLDPSFKAAPLPEVKVPIPLSEAYLTDNFGGAGIQGIDGVNKLIHFTITKDPANASNGHKFSVPFDNFYTIRRVSVVSGGATGDYFQYDYVVPIAGATPTADEYAAMQAFWFKEFEKGNLQLLIDYAGTTETHTIGMKEIYRAAGLLEWDYANQVWAPLAEPKASIIGFPNMMSTEADAIIARLDYYGSNRFPNQIVDLAIPVWEFGDEISFEPKPNMSEYVIPIQVNPVSGVPVVISNQVVRAIAATYDVCAAYTKSGEPTKYRRFENILVDPTPGLSFPINAGVPAMFRTGTTAGVVDFANTSGEIDERTLTFTIPIATFNTLSGTSNYPAPASAPNFVAELEVLVLPE